MANLLINILAIFGLFDYEQQDNNIDYPQSLNQIQNRKLVEKDPCTEGVVRLGEERKQR